jgi:SPP1 gp7 family putative phage head morphogenesis protein
MNCRLYGMERRLNRRLSGIVSGIIRKLLENPFYNPREYDAVIRQAYKDYIRGVYSLGEREMVKNPHVELKGSVLGPGKLESIIESRSFNASQRTLDRLHGDIYKRIREGIHEGQSLGKTTRMLEGEFRGMSHGELMRISRTETQSVYNQSKMETMRASWLVQYKKWVSSGLDNMRESHVELDGEIVPVDEPFSNGLIYPGDESGPVEEVVNCACTMVPVIESVNVEGD